MQKMSWNSSPAPCLYKVGPCPFGGLEVLEHQGLQGSFRILQAQCQLLPRLLSHSKVTAIGKPEQRVPKPDRKRGPESSGVNRIVAS